MSKLKVAVLIALSSFIAGCGSSEPIADTESVGLIPVTINYPNRSGSQWPLFLAKEGGYYEKYGLDVTLTFGVMPTGIAMLTSGEGQMVNSSLEQLMQAASRDGSMSLIGSSLNRGTFALMATNDITSMEQLRGKRIAVSQIGDAPYGYINAMLAQAGLTSRDVNWIPVGQGASGRAAALTSGRADATLLTAPAYFRVEEEGYTTLANMAEFQEIFASTAYIMNKSDRLANPALAEALIKAHAEAIKRFYDDKAFAVEAYRVYDDASEADVSRIYDLYAQPQAFERVPYVLTGAVESVIEQQADPQMAEQMKNYDFTQVIDNSIVDKLVADGFFVELFGDGIVAEQNTKAPLAFGR